MNIYYFGGYLATQANVDTWRVSLQKKLPDATISAYPWPKEASAVSPLEAEGWNDAREELTTTMFFEKDITVVGHSSGCAYANDIALYLLKSGKKDFKLIALDGYTPNESLMALPGTVRWSAVGPNGRKSRNYVDPAPPHYRVYTAKVQWMWPLHFSLVNLNVSDEHNRIEEGYWNCDANLEVLGYEETKV